MQKWKYNFCYAQIENEDLFTPNSNVTWIWTKRRNQTETAMAVIQRMGKEGWELVSVTPVSTTWGDNNSGLTRQILFTFKMPID